MDRRGGRGWIRGIDHWAAQIGKVRMRYSGEKGDAAGERDVDRSVQSRMAEFHQVRHNDGSRQERSRESREKLRTVKCKKKRKEEAEGRKDGCGRKESCLSAGEVSHGGTEEWWTRKAMGGVAPLTAYSVESTLVRDAPRRDKGRKSGRRSGKRRCDRGDEQTE